MNKIWLTIGILCFLVPALLQVSDKRNQASIIDTYDKEILVYEDEAIETCMEQALAYNKSLYELKKSAVGNEVFLDYDNQLNLTKTGMMGHLQIPDLGLRLPIYHGTGDDVLASGIGHLEGTSLPVGGEHSHSVLTGHRGLPSAELFTRLDEMREGDFFYLSICNQVFGYKVINVQIVEPSQVEVIDIEENRDLVSLVTCTPYGLNTHRLVVTGERVEEQEIVMSETKIKGGVDEKIYDIMGVCVVLLLLFVCGSIGWKIRHCRKRK